MEHNELKHHGVLGMKWGVRRATVKSARKEYKSSKKKAKEEYGKTIKSINKGYDPNDSTYSKQDRATVNQAKSTYRKSLGDAHTEYKADKNKPKYKSAKKTAAKTYLKTMGKVNSKYENDSDRPYTTKDVKKIKAAKAKYKQNITKAKNTYLNSIGKKTVEDGTTATRKKLKKVGKTALLGAGISGAIAIGKRNYEE